MTSEQEQQAAKILAEIFPDSHNGGYLLIGMVSNHDDPEKREKIPFSVKMSSNIKNTTNMLSCAQSATIAIKRTIDATLDHEK